MINEEIDEGVHCQLPRIGDAWLATMLARSISLGEALGSLHVTIGRLTSDLLVLPLARQAMLREALRSEW